MFSKGSTSAEVIIKGLQNVSLEEKSGEEIESGFQYPLRPYEPDCVFFMKHGFCGYGPACVFNHPINKRVKMMSYSRPCEVAEYIPGRAPKKDCKYYSSPGGCRHGNSCRFAHYTERTDIRQMTPNPTDPPAQPNLVEAKSSPSRRNVKCLHGISPTIAEERDTDDEGSDYDEEFEKESERRLAELASVPVGPTGLPLRPERPLCIYYSRYGLCCYGPACPDDHTLDRALAQRRTRGNKSS